MSDYLPRPEGITEYEWQYFLNTDSRQQSYIKDKVRAAMNTEEYRAIAVEKSTEHFTKWMEQKKGREVVERVLGAVKIGEGPSPDAQAVINRMRALVRLLVSSGDMTPQAKRIIEKALDEEENRDR